DPGAQPAPVDERDEHPGLGQVLEVLARLAEPRALHPDRTDPELSVDQMAQRHADRREIAPAVGRRELDPEALASRVHHTGGEGLENLDLDQRDLAPAVARPGRVEAQAREVPVAFEPTDRKSVV